MSRLAASLGPALVRKNETLGVWPRVRQCGQSHYFGVVELGEELLLVPAVLLFLWCFLCVAFLVLLLVVVVVVVVSLEPAVDDQEPLCELPDEAV